jgi:cation diffusion facilitator family transporter
MTDSCCQDKSSTLSQLRGRQTRVLRTALWLNATMFVVEFAAGLSSGSAALLADSLDMLGDAAVYAVTLYAIARGVVWELRAALLKAMVMGCFGALVLVHVVLRAMTDEPPQVEIMGVIGALALGVNTLCFALLWRHRASDLNMRSVWLCSRNDVLSNLSVLLAAWLVWLTGSVWPDLLIGTVVCGMFAHSAVRVGHAALRELRRRRIQSFHPPCCSACRGLLISRMPEHVLTAGFAR